ncbi:MAG TPA: substrate-binding domain-containing protein [Polyangiaceae bacterium]|nr:substrate-binding domain-containing protein [Polyangiaceae bacterium]
MNRRLQALSCIVGLALGVSACSSDGSAAATKKVTRTTVADSEFQPSDLEKTVDALVTKISNTAPVDMQVAVVLKQLNNYYLPIQTGANRAMSELNLAGQVVAPQSSAGNDAVTEQNDIMNSELDSGYNALAVAPFEVGNQPPIDAAASSDVPVVTIDSDLASSKRDLYIGTMNSEAGKTAGTTLTSLITSNSGTVILLGHDDAGWPDGFDRTNGAKDVLESAGFTVVVRRTDWSETGEDADIEFLKTAITDADPPVVGMMGMFSDAYRCAMAAEAVGKTGDDIAIAAFDFEPKTVEYMRSGMIKATHAQRQYYMGYMTPYVLYGFKALGKEATKSLLKTQMVDDYRFNTGLDVIPAAKLDAYYSYLDKLGVGSSL